MSEVNTIKRTKKRSKTRARKKRFKLLIECHVMQTTEKTIKVHPEKVKLQFHFEFCRAKNEETKAKQIFSLQS